MRYALERYPVENFNAYQPVKSDRLMVTGNFDKKVSYYKKGSGKEISPEKALKKSPDKVREVVDPAKHEVIFYVNRDNPLGSMFPDLNDPMLLRWEQALNESDLDNQNQNTEGDFPSVPM